MLKNSGKLKIEIKKNEYNIDGIKYNDKLIFFFFLFEINLYKNLLKIKNYKLKVIIII